MKGTFMKKMPLLTAIFALTFAIVARAADSKSNPAATPAPRDPDWVKRHEAFADIAKKGGIDLLFMGDSITNRWRNAGKDSWEKNFAPLHAANFGMGGDCTQHVLWRLQNGELEGIKPKLIVLMIGTNNLSANKDEEIADGIKAIVADVHKQRPETKILLLGVFPRGMKAKDSARGRIKHINSLIASLDDGGKTVKYMDIGDKFLDPDGTLPKSVMPDGLHPNTKGYEIFAEAITPTVQAMMK
jgi:lysophospholipase L1-like esterase